MNPPAWLAELHRQWYDTRGLSLRPPTRPFSRDWHNLLDAAGLRSAADRSHAEAEAKSLENRGRLAIRTHKYRKYLIEKIALPIAQERWLIELFGGTPAVELHSRSLEIVAASRFRSHPRLPESWEQLCRRLSAAFGEGKNVSPFYWKDPPELERLLGFLRQLTTKEWPAGTSIRNASEALGIGSKALEEEQRLWEHCLTLLVGEQATFESLGLSGTQSPATLHGRLRLRFADGSEQHYHNLRGEFTISGGDLERAVDAATGAARILTIENTNTTFRQAVAANTDGATLIIATSYPNAATKRLLELLQPSLPHYHFGDTDASGYAILRSLREIGRGPVRPFLMTWRDEQNSKSLSEHDHRLLPALLGSPLMTDCLESLRAMEKAGRKGKFEQEAYGAPTLEGWPFWEKAATAFPPDQ